MAAALPQRLDEAAAIDVGRQLCELSAHIQAAQAELVLRLADFDDGAGWAAAGIRSCCHWLSIEAGLDYHTSADLLRVGHALAELPLIRRAFGAGQLSLDKVRALLLVATPADEEVWLEMAVGADARRLARMCREIRRSMDADAPGQSGELEAKRGLWTRVREDGMHRLVALLPPEDAGLVTAALEAVARSKALPPKEPARDVWAGRRLDSLTAVCEHALGSAPEELVGAPGAVHAAEVARRLGCDADVVAITEKDGLPIDVGRKRRLFTARQRRALQARDRTCRFPGCPVPASRTSGHHIEPWWLGGRTDIANGLSLCNAHHGRLHEGAFRVVPVAGGEVRFETAAGTEIAPPRRAPLDPATGGPSDLRRQHRERGLEIGPETPVSRWLGEECDYHYVADVFADAAYLARTRAGP
ncbi:MAG: DUF222 domain-containing protein [Chloroflexi bacterium]|nr:MAG: DUF222 domain-containing protein [Chloroflexota bacterium]